ncbi:MAG: DUF4170 domain-containing protein [Rhodobacteraceae bacterium]|nr:DUF4170 domain-containing protein [Paracoccaceae bacterium]
MTNRLHLVFGGELIDPQGQEFRDPENIETIGIYSSYAKAYDAWKAAAHSTVDNAHMRYFIAHLHRLRDEKTETSLTAEMG